MSLMEGSASYDSDGHPAAAASTMRVAFYQFCCATLPLFIVLCFFLIVAYNRPYKPYYAVNDDQVRFQIGSTEPMMDLMQMLYVFLAILPLWTSFLAHLNMFIPKRRALIRHYIENAETLTGDVWVEPNSSRCQCKRSWILWNCSGCFGIWAKDYGELVYKVNLAATATKDQTITKGIVSKCVRTYKPWSRERVPILVLPGLPRSGLVKSDVEIDVKTHSGNDVVKEIYYLIAFWIVFIIFGSVYLITQMAKLFDEVGNVEKAWTILLCVVLFHGPLIYGMTWLRYYHYRHWLTNSGIITHSGSNNSTKKDTSRGSESGEGGAYTQMA
jgi:hypothetical protein